MPDLLNLTVIRWSNDMVWVTGPGGGPVPELQGPYGQVRADVLNAAGVTSSFNVGHWLAGGEGRRRLLRVSRERWAGGVRYPDLPPDMPANLCGLCGMPYLGPGNSPEPVLRLGPRVCDTCNITVIIPARLARSEARRDD